MKLSPEPRPRFFSFAHWSVMRERSVILINLQNNALIDKACTKKSFVCHQTELDFSLEYLPTK